MNVEVDIVGAIVALFLLFWLQSGWYRVDCALHVSKACELIKGEYDRNARP